MCTLIVLHRSVPGAPLVVAANRDEFLDRPAEGLALREQPGGAILAPLDLRAGGTWLGLSGWGVFAAVTNRRAPHPDPGRRSRGEAVPHALEARDAAGAARLLEALPERAYNPFNAVVADGERAFALVYEDAPALQEFAPGPHVVGNADPDARDVPKVARVQRHAERAGAAARETVLDELAEVCREHGEGAPSLDDTCVHLGVDAARDGAARGAREIPTGYGTRSSMLLLVADEPGESRLRWADGPPCRHPYRDSTPLLLELGRRAGSAVGDTSTRKAS